MKQGQQPRRGVNVANAPRRLSFIGNGALRLVFITAHSPWTARPARFSSVASSTFLNSIYTQMPSLNTTPQTSMTNVASSSQPTLGFIEVELLPHPQLRLPPAVNTSRLVGEARIDTFSPVNQNGSFEFDRVLKSGEQWKKMYLVLRPNLLSAYKTSSEERLHKQISLSDLNAVAQLKDPKGRREHLFSLYTPARNYHLQARDENDAKSWVELIKKEARIDEEDQGLPKDEPLSVDGDHEAQLGSEHLEHERYTSSSPEPIDFPGRRSTTREGVKIPGVRKPSVHNLDFSGDEGGTYSDWSDTPRHSFAQVPHEYLDHQKIRPAPGLNPLASSSVQTGTTRNASHSSGSQVQDEERVVWHGYLLILKSTRGVRQWKKMWAVLRPKNLAFYKTDEEYAAQLIIPLSNIINAVEIDPLSRTKAYCMQIIAEEKNFRCCAPSEEALAKWLGALKSQLARRREARNIPAP
ncbi:MAG: hypothetical protein Q9170_003236 [Blastenia crenularia]